ncbi:unnamed protein product [Arabis nemorensis]|uniref:non-specific serine/threonine protein kinase n=1 Tax=Arabis nemorensis TaxID=586526 RepID=A0A565CHN2_9BRAS|nr:unnamed protein product [Arabis nemorensis]
MRIVWFLVYVICFVEAVKGRLGPGTCDSPESCDHRVKTLLSIIEAFGYPPIFSEIWQGHEPCNWYGITCFEGRITLVTFISMNLTGSISPSFADITSLSVIDLSHNRLTGIIPFELTKLNLESLDVSYNDLHGKVPQFRNTVPDTQGNPKIETGIIHVPSQPKIPVQTLRLATDDFDSNNIIGRGGFGTVYRGMLQDATEVAVKRMEQSVIGGKGLDQFKAEVSVLTKVHHRNLVVLQGYCIEGNERLLVYQYMPLGSLSRHLFHWKDQGLEPLGWSRRLAVALDVARGVEYLHRLAHQSYIHRDLKTSNILLGEDMRAKVSDFGLVRSIEEGRESFKTKNVGTYGYMAPEYALTGRVSRKIDVYSFGVVLMELITGQNAIDENRSGNDALMATWFKKMFAGKDSFTKIIDEPIEVNEETQGSISQVAELAGYCCAKEPEQRPEMSHVVTALASLVEQWKPRKVEEDSATDMEMVTRWKQQLDAIVST